MGSAFCVLCRRGDASVGRLGLGVEMLRQTTHHISTRKDEHRAWKHGAELMATFPKAFVEYGGPGSR